MNTKAEEVSKVKGLAFLLIQGSQMVSIICCKMAEHPKITDSATFSSSLPKLIYFVRKVSLQTPTTWCLASTRPFKIFDVEQYSSSEE
jgi:hypothetical protein